MLPGATARPLATGSGLRLRLGNSMGAEWFQRLGDVPGLDYTPPVVVDRTALPRYDAAPEIRHYDVEDRPLTVVSWGWEPDEDDPEASVSSAAPATAHLREVLEDGWAGGDFWPTERLLQRLYEALELPGEGEDYHRALTQVQRALAPRMLAEPDVLDVLEWLASLDVRLLIAYPQAVNRHVPEGGEVFLGNSGFNDLVQLYRREGFLRDALELAELEQRHFPGNGDHWLDDIATRLEAIRGEAIPES